MQYDLVALAGVARDQRGRESDAPLVHGVHRSGRRQPGDPGHDRRLRHDPVRAPAPDRPDASDAVPRRPTEDNASSRRPELSQPGGPQLPRDPDPQDPQADFDVTPEPASFRDPAGFVYRRDGTLLRQINRSFAGRWDRTVASGLLQRLQADGRLIPHEEAPLDAAADPVRAHAVIRPTEVAFVSYPPEWSFGMLRDAALLTLDVQAEATAAGFALRDASASNVLFSDGRPILVDTLSIAPAEPGAPWVAYRQFCEHFLAPLALMARRDIRLGGLLRAYLDGIPLDLAARLLPARTRLDLGLGSHIHVHAGAQRRHEGGGDAAAAKARRARVGGTRAAALLDSLRRTVASLRWSPTGTEWADYERADPTDTANRDKDGIVRSMLAEAGGAVVWDLGANIGRHSAIAAGLGRRVVAWDADPAAVERHYSAIQATGETRILPLVADLANPSAAAGWALGERRSMIDRADADVLLALALVHHLAIGRNVPLPRIAAFFAELAPNAIVEWVGRDDPLVRRLLATREDVFDTYNPDGFEAAFGGPASPFRVADRQPIPGTERAIVRLLRRS
jgi:hypothetical protein